MVLMENVNIIIIKVGLLMAFKSVCQIIEEYKIKVGNKNAKSKNLLPF